MRRQRNGSITRIMPGSFSTLRYWLKYQNPKLHTTHRPGQLSDGPRHLSISRWFLVRYCSKRVAPIGHPTYRGDEVTRGRSSCIAPLVSPRRDPVNLARPTVGVRSTKKWFGLSHRFPSCRKRHRHMSEQVIKVAIHTPDKCRCHPRRPEQAERSSGLTIFSLKLGHLVC